MTVALGAKAFAIAAALLVLMLPTFNALNVAEFSGEPPFKFDPPDDFQPPDDAEGEFSDGDSEFEVPPSAGAAAGGCSEYRPVDDFGEWQRFSPSPTSMFGEAGSVHVDVPADAVAVSLVVVFEDWRGTLDAQWTGPGNRSGDEAYSTGLGSASSRNGEDVRPLEDVAPGRWDADWLASTYTGEGAIALAYRTLECADAAPGNATEDA